MATKEELIEQIDQAFQAASEQDKKLSALKQKAQDGTANYRDAAAYAQRISGLSSKAANGYDMEEYGVGDAWAEYLAQILPDRLKKNSDLIAEYANLTQQGLNQKAGIHLRVQEPDRDPDRIAGIVKHVTDAEDSRQAAMRAQADVENYDRHIVDSSIQNNADFQYSAGLQPKIVRTGEATMCEWCAQLVGVYKYPDVPQEVYQRHANCNCEITFEPADGRRGRQNVHTKQWNDDTNPKRIEYRKNTQGLQNDRDPGRIALREKQAFAEQSRFKPGPDERAIVSDVVGTETYGLRMRRLGENERTTSIMTHEARTTLWHRNGYEFEDLIFINPETGEHKAQRKQNAEQQVGPTDEMKKMVLDNPRSIIAMHNHPHSMLPSMADLKMAQRYKYGVVLCHDGTVIKYEVSDDADIDTADLLLDLMQDRLAKGEELSLQLQELSSLGVYLEVIK